MIDDETALQWLFSFHEATIGRVKKGRPRLLLMDNHGSHTTHLCQLLDGQAFQSLKHHFHTMNNEVVTWGGSASKKRDSFRVIEGVREQALTQRTIRTSLKFRSIYPLDPEVVLTPLRQRDLEGSPPPDFSSSVTNSPPDTIERVEKLNTKLINDLERIEHLKKSVNRHIQRSIDANTLLSQEMNY